MVKNFIIFLLSDVWCRTVVNPLHDILRFPTATLHDALIDHSQRVKDGGSVRSERVETHIRQITFYESFFESARYLHRVVSEYALIFFAFGNLCDDLRREGDDSVTCLPRNWKT